MFQFQLQSVLKIKEKIEEQKKIELGQAIKNQEEIKREKSTLISKQDEVLKAMQLDKASTIDLNHLRLYYRYELLIDKAISDKEVQLDEASRMVTQKRAALMEAVKDRKVLERLKDIKEETYKEEEKYIEQRIVDDMVTYKYGSKKGELDEKEEKS